MFLVCSSYSREKRQAVCKPGSVPAPEGPGDGHSSGTPVTGRLARPTRTTGPETGPAPWRAPSLLGLAPGGVYPAATVAGGAVRAYRTLSPSPASRTRRWAPAGRLLSVALSLGSPPPGVTRHRVSVEPGLSSPAFRRERPSDRLTHHDVGAGRHEYKMTAGRGSFSGEAKLQEFLVLRSPF